MTLWTLSMRLLLFISLFLTPPTPVCSNESQSCTLYQPPALGIHCFHGSQAEEAVTESKWAWMVEFYSSWCGHCQNFAPQLKELASEMEAWSDVIRVGVVECTASEKNQEMCGKMGVEAYPTIRFFPPHHSTPLKTKDKIIGGRKITELRHLIVKYVASVTPYPQEWPNLDLLTSTAILQEPASTWMPSIFIFEQEQSYLGKELIMDLMKVKSIRIRRISDQNTGIVRHYSILEFPSAVVELQKDRYHVLAGHSLRNPRSELKEMILSYIHDLIGTTQLPLESHDRKSIPIPQKIEKPPPHKRIHHRSNRVDLTDLLSAISYGLRSEVPLHSIISGSTYSSLFNFVTLLDQVFAHVGPVAVGKSLQGVRLKLESRNSAGFITNRDWHRILTSKLDPDVFPYQPTWKMCNGSLPHLRGYPCGLWMLSHTLTLHTLPINQTHHLLPSKDYPRFITSRRALVIIINFIRNFFSCEVCRRHFADMAETVPRGSRGDNGNAILWLWEAHNSVSARLKKEGGGDPKHPKDLFPSITKCPYCYQHLEQITCKDLVPSFDNTRFLEGESLTEKRREREKRHINNSRSFYRSRQLRSMQCAFVWNRTAVLLHLWNFYHLNEHYGNVTDKIRMGLRHRHHGRHVSQHSILQAAWPQLESDHHWKYAGAGRGRGIGFHPQEENLCILSYVVSVMSLGVISFWLYRKRRTIFRHFNHYFRH